MVEPTARMMDQFDRYGAKLSIMADVAEILKFKEYYETTGNDTFHYRAIANQLQDAIRRGHDVQLHLHPSYFNAKSDGKCWIQDWSEYNFATLPIDRMSFMVRTGKAYLENLLRPVKADYECIAFRAANWAAQPSRNLVNVLIANGLSIDTSVFKNGKRNGLVGFDYSSAPSAFKPWRVSENDICQNDPVGQIWEYPIYAESRALLAFATPVRCYRAMVGRFHKVPTSLLTEKQHQQYSIQFKKWLRILFALFSLFTWKADFNQCSGRQLKNAIDRVRKQDTSSNNDPFILIGHSKLFGILNQWSLIPFLKKVQKEAKAFTFSNLSQFRRKGEA